MESRIVRINGVNFMVPANELTDPNPDGGGNCGAVEPDWPGNRGGLFCTITHEPGTAHIAHNDEGVIAIWPDLPA